MPLEPIPNWKLICNHPEHNPPMHICIPQGYQYRHKCPACGVETIIVQQNSSLEPTPYWLQPNPMYTVWC